MASDLHDEASRSRASPPHRLGWFIALTLSTASAAPLALFAAPALDLGREYGTGSGRDGALFDLLVVGLGGLAAACALVFVPSTGVLLVLTRRWNRPLVWLASLVMPLVSAALGFWWAGALGDPVG
jgi:hypothetical protein